MYVFFQSMLLPILEDPKRTSSSDEIIKTISTRVAGGRRELNKDPSRVCMSSYDSCDSVLVLSGHCRHERVPVYVALVAACYESACYPRDLDCR